MKIIVLAVTPYKENDAIIDAVSEMGKVTFYVKGIQSAKGGNSFLNTPLTVAEITFVDGEYAYPVLKNAKLISSPFNKQMKLDVFSSALIIQEITKKLCLENDYKEIYPLLLTAIEEQNRDFPFVSVLVYFFKILNIIGYSFDVKACVNCGSKKEIVAFSYEDGGFLCKNCISNQQSNLNGEDLLNIRKCILANGKKVDFAISEQSANKILNILKDFVAYAMDVKLNSIGLANIKY